MNKIFGKFKKHYLTDKPNKTEWIIGIISLVLIYFTMYYRDNFVIALSYFWDNNSLYNWSGLAWLGRSTMPYGQITKWMFELWLTPFNILYRIFGWDCNNVINIWWYKALAPIFLTLTLRKIGEIATTLKIKKEYIPWIRFICLTSVLVALPVFHIAQTDAIYLYFMILGYSEYLKNNRKKFVLFFAIAVSMKFISLFVFIPLLLLSEKRILRILLDLILSVIIIPVEEIWYKFVSLLQKLMFKPVAQTATTMVSGNTVDAFENAANKSVELHFFHKMLFFEFPAMRKGYTASILVVLFLLLCIWCYIQKKEEAARLSIYAAAVGMLIFFTFSSPSPYWIVISYPFILLMIYTRPEALRINLLLELVYMLITFFIYVWDSFWVYGGSTSFDYLPIEKMGIVKFGHEFQGGPTVKDYLAKLPFESIMNIIMGIGFASAIALVIINRPGSKVEEEISDEDIKVLHHGIATFQVVFLLVWYFICLYTCSRY